VIHPDVEIIDLYPLTWRNVGALFRIDEWSNNRPYTNEKVLSILHDHGHILKIDAPAGISISADVAAHLVTDPRALAQSLFYANPHLMRVQIFEKNALSAYSANVQRLDWRHLASGDFYLNAFQIADADPVGLCYYPPERAPYALQQRVLKTVDALVKSTPDGSALVLGIYDQGQPYFTLILQVRAGLITLCTTFEHLAPQGIDPMLIPASESDSTRVIVAVEKAVGPVAHALFCDRATLEQWMHPNALYS
jgi:hypothetical protein